MRNVFIVNPNAGKPGRAAALCEHIRSRFSEIGGKYKIHIAKNRSDGRELALQEASKGDEVRIFACGGDGTAFHVLNGMTGFKNAALGIIPCGTANDFIKYFGEKSHDIFSDIGAQLSGCVRRVDAVKALGQYALNQCSIGMDADVCANKDRFSRLPLIDGQAAYIMSLFYCFLSSIKNRLTIQIDKSEPVTGDFLFAVAANGRYYGGGFKSAPDAILDDGMIDCLAIDSVSRLKIASLLKCYTRGDHVGKPFCHLKRGKRMTVTAKKETAVNMDGEVYMTKEVTFEAAPNAVRLVVPRGCEDAPFANKPKNGKTIEPGAAFG